MSALVKLGAVSAVGAGATFTAVSMSGGISSGISWTSLKVEKSHTDKTKVGGAFGSLLVGVYGENDKNEAWWKDSYARYLRDQKANTQLSDEFKKEKVKDAFTKKIVTVSTSASPSKSLNLVCKDIYDQEKDKVKVPEDNSHSNFDLRRDFWKYCSPLGSTPFTIKDANGNYSDGKIGKTKASDVLSTWKDYNILIWSIREKQFLSLDSDSITSLFFKNFREGKSSAKTLRDLCSSAYEKVSSTGGETDETKVSEADVIKYCSIEDQQA